MYNFKQLKDLPGVCDLATQKLDKAYNSAIFKNNKTLLTDKINYIHAKGSSGHIYIQNYLIYNIFL